MNASAEVVSAVQAVTVGVQGQAEIQTITTSSSTPTLCSAAYEQCGNGTLVAGNSTLGTTDTFVFTEPFLARSEVQTFTSSVSTRTTVQTITTRADTGQYIAEGSFDLTLVHAGVTETVTLYPNAYAGTMRNSLIS